MRHDKTNAMRLLDRAGISYDVLAYPYDPDDLSGVKAASAMNMPACQVYKTLVAHGDKTGHLICCLAVDQTIDLKKLARLSGNKQVALVSVNELLPLTGYQRGGCSPVGLKKQWPAYLDEAILALDRVAVSAGQRGLQMVLAPADLIRITGAAVGSVATGHAVPD